MTFIQRRIALFLSIFIVASSGGFAQVSGQCGTSVLFNKMMQSDPEISKQRKQFESDAKEFLKDHQSRTNSGGPFLVPVVVHVVYNSGDLTQNITDQQIQSQITVLNEDFR